MNKTIYILWFQGFDQAPDIVKKCVESWKYYNPDWNILLLDNANLCNYINLEDHDHIDITKKNINYTALSDIVRISLLNIYGGLWVDATTFCNKPLNDWLIKYANKGFFAFNKPGPDRLLSTWFIYSEKGHYIVNSWFNSIIVYYKTHHNPHTYFWVHYLFGDLYNCDDTFMNVWNTVPKLSANGYGPHYLQEKGMFKKLTSNIKKDIDDKITPLYKLTYKCKFPDYCETLNTYYLFSTI